MTNRRATPPLNTAAVRAASDDFYARYPEMVVDGKRQPLSPDDPAAAAKRKAWMDGYERHGGTTEPVRATTVAAARQQADGRFSAAAVANPVTGCPNAAVVPAATAAIRTPPAAPADQTPVCELLSIGLSCEHGRRPGPEGLLMVVPNSTASIGDKVIGEMKIRGGCGQHPSWSVGGMTTSTGNGTSFDFTAKTFAPSIRGFFSLANVTPQTYRVQASCCAGGPRVFEVRAYPPGRVAAKLDVGAITDQIRNALRILPVPEQKVEEWTSQWFRGSVEYAGAWKEDSSWRAYYEKSISGGFDPLIGMSYKGPVYPLTLVPGWLASWVKAGLFYELKFGAKFQCALKGKSWPDSGVSEWRERTVGGGGSGGGALSLELKLVSSDVVEGAVSGESGIGLEVVGTSGDEPKVELAIKFDGVKGKCSLKAAWGWVELSREFQLVQERELYRKEWLLAGEA